MELQDRTAHVLLDMRFAESAPIAVLPCLNWFGVWFRDTPNEDEYVSASEEAIIVELERQLVQVVGRCADGWAVYCIRIMSRGLAEYYLYSKNAATLSKVVSEMNRDFPEYRIEHEAKADPNWSEYIKYRSAIN